MRQHTTKEQTTKLIELGFERPENGVIKQLLDRSTGLWITIGEEGDYSIGELIDFLDKYHFPTHIRIGGVKVNNVINQNHEEFGGELIDLLFNLCVKIKEEEQYDTNRSD